MRLTVIHNFSIDIHGALVEYERGHQVTDPEVIEQILASENANSVVKTMNGDKQ